MLLNGRRRWPEGGGGSIGGAVARAFAPEGATVVLAGRAAATLDAVAGDILAAGGLAVTSLGDALDEQAVDEHADAVAAEHGGIGISFNPISHGDVQGTPMAEMAAEDGMRPIATAVRTTSLTTRAAAPHDPAGIGGSSCSGAPAASPSRSRRASPAATRSPAGWRT